MIKSLQNYLPFYKKIEIKILKQKSLIFSCFLPIYSTTDTQK